MTYVPLGEMADKLKMVKWKIWFNIASNNLDENPDGHGMFVYHFNTYLTYRVVNGTRNTYNTTKAKHTQMFEHAGSFKKSA